MSCAFDAFSLKWLAVKMEEWTPDDIFQCEERLESDIQCRTANTLLQKVWVHMYNKPDTKHSTNFSYLLLLLSTRP